MTDRLHPILSEVDRAGGSHLMRIATCAAEERGRRLRVPLGRKQGAPFKAECQVKNCMVERVTGQPCDRIFPVRGERSH